MAGRWLWAALPALGALVAREAAAVARVVRREDPGGRDDHDATFGTGTAESLEVVFLGDSAVDGHGLSVGESLPHQVAARLAASTGRRVRVRSLAVSGATSADVAVHQLDLLRAAGEVDAVVVGVGVNDALQRVRRDAVSDATRTVVAGVREIAPDGAFAYVPCHDLTAAPGLGPVLRRVLGARCRAVARCQRVVLEHEGVAIAAASALGHSARGDTTMFGDDGLHPGAQGIEVISSLVADALLADDQLLTAR